MNVCWRDLKSSVQDGGIIYLYVPEAGETPDDAEISLKTLTHRNLMQIMIHFTCMGVLQHDDPTSHIPKLRFK